VTFYDLIFVLKRHIREYQQFDKYHIYKIRTLSVFRLKVANLKKLIQKIRTPMANIQYSHDKAKTLDSFCSCPV